jgi:hypothetical protein
MTTETTEQFVQRQPACKECGAVQYQRYGHLAECSQFLEDAAPRTHTCIDSNSTPTGLFCVACVEEREDDQTATTTNDNDEVSREESLQHQVAALVVATGEQTFGGAMTWIQQQRRSQPAPNTGEWHARQTLPGEARAIFDSEGRLVANGVTGDITAQIVVDHNTLPKLVDVLNLFLAMDNCNYELETMRRSGLFDQIAAALADLGERGKRYGDRLTTLRNGGAGSE